MNDTTQDTRGSLMDAARVLFARHGYNGASVRAITARAGANLGAVTYHFGTKEALYHEMLTGMVSPLRDRIEAVVDLDAPVLDRLDAVVEAYFEHFALHPDIPRLLLERIASGQLPPPPVAALMQSILGAVSGLVRQGQTDGTVRSGDPFLMTLSLIAQPVYLTLVKNPLERLTGHDVTSGEGFDHLVAHARAFVRAGLTSPSSSPAP